MKPQAATLTPRIRELLRQRSGASLADGFSSLLDNLLELSKHSRTTEDHRLILQTLEHIDRNKRGLAEAFERHLLALYDEKLGWLRESDRTSGAPRAFGEFNLLDDNGTVTDFRQAGTPMDLNGGTEKRSTRATSSASKSACATCSKHPSTVRAIRSDPARSSRPRNVHAPPVSKMKRYWPR